MCADFSWKFLYIFNCLSHVTTKLDFIVCAKRRLSVVKANQQFLEDCNLYEQVD